MNRVSFESTPATFILERNGITIPFRYYPDFNNVWKNLSDDSFTVFLLNNPFLHKESDVFEISLEDKQERCGYIFPIALLESEEEQTKALLSYMLVSYRIILKNLQVDNPTGILSDSYPDAFILSLHNETISEFQLDEYRISLASYGFYDYRGSCDGKFPLLDFFDSMHKRIILKRSTLDYKKNDYVCDLLDSKLCIVSDFFNQICFIISSCRTIYF